MNTLPGPTPAGMVALNIWPRGFGNCTCCPGAIPGGTRTLTRSVAGAGVELDAAAAGAC